MRQLYLFAAFFVIYEFNMYASNDMIMPGMLQVVSDFHAPVSYVANSLTLFLLGTSIVQLFLGPLAEKFGKRKVILTGNVLYLIFTLFIALSSNIDQFMWGRLLQGSGLAFIAMGYALIHEKFDDKGAVKIIAIMGNVSLLAPLFGPVIGGAIISISSWHYVFVLSAILGVVSLVGLYKNTPECVPSTHNIELKNIVKIYAGIFMDKKFLLGTACMGLLFMPFLSWIGLAPIIIMRSEHLSFGHYLTYQIIAISGLTCSSLLMQYVAGRFSFFKLISVGNAIGLVGLTIGFVFSQYIEMVVFGLFIYGFGIGMYTGLIIRIIMEIDPEKYPQTFVASLMVFLQTMIMVPGIEIINAICGRFNFSVLSFTSINIVIGIVFFTLVRRYAKMNQHRQWQ